MTQMVKSETPNNHQKKVTITETGGKRWTIEFEGEVTRRDVQKLYRLITVEFAKVMRKRSLVKFMKERRLIAETAEAAESQQNTKETPFTPKEQTNATTSTGSVQKEPS